MTTTIAALCDASNDAQTGNFIMCADTLVTWSANGLPVSSNPGGSKIYDLPYGFYIAIAGDISQSHQIVSYLHHQMDSIGPLDPNFVDLVKKALERTGEYVRLWMRREILGEYSVSLDEFLHGNLRNRAQIARHIKDCVVLVQLIVAGFTSNGLPVLFYTDCINIQEQTNPGFFCFCGGVGARSALDWLNFREQNCFMTTQRTFYHVREAKQYSEVSPVVGKLNHTILLRAGKKAKSLSESTPLLSEWGNKFLPKSTKELDQSWEWDALVSAYEIDL